MLLTAENNYKVSKLMTASLSLEHFSEMLEHLYQGPLQSVPWNTFLDKLKDLLSSKYATFILRPPSQHVDGLSISTAGSSMEVTSSYHQHFYRLDPFVDLPNRQVVSLTEFVSVNDWLNSLQLREVEFEDEAAFANINTQDELARANQQQA